MGNDLGVMRSWRVVPPAHFTLKIDKFSLFLQTVSENYESQIFEAGGYKWRLSLYPKGKKKPDLFESGYISLYLSIVDTDHNPPLPHGWEVNAQCRFFVFNQIKDKYFTVRDRVRRFHKDKTEWGIDNLLDLSTFNDPISGYLVDDCCIFGAEVFVLTSNGVGECVSTLTYPLNSTYKWKIDNYSAIEKEIIRSEVFLAGEHKWNLVVYPQGHGSLKGKKICLLLALAEPVTASPQRKVYAQFKLRVINQKGGKNIEFTGKHGFSSSTSVTGFYMLSLSELNSERNGYKLKDSVTVEAEITHVSTSKDFVKLV